MSLANINTADFIKGSGVTQTGRVIEFSGAAGVETYANYASFPVSGSAGILYIATDTGSTYYWNGSAYIQVGGNPTTSNVLIDCGSFTAPNENLLIDCGAF